MKLRVKIYHHQYQKNSYDAVSSGWLGKAAQCIGLKRTKTQQEGGGVGDCSLL